MNKKDLLVLLGVILQILALISLCIQSIMQVLNTMQVVLVSTGSVFQLIGHFHFLK